MSFDEIVKIICFVPMVIMLVCSVFVAVSMSIYMVIGTIRDIRRYFEEKKKNGK